MRDDDLLTIGQMCETFGVTPRTLRFYESRKLITPLRQGQLRLYSRRERGRLTLILRGRRFGFSLEEMRERLDLYDRDGQATQLARTYAIAEKRLAPVVMLTAFSDTGNLRRCLEAGAVGGNLADEFAAAHDEDAVGKGEDFLEVFRDQQHRRAGQRDDRAGRAEQPGQLLDRRGGRQRPFHSGFSRSMIDRGSWASVSLVLS